MNEQQPTDPAQWPERPFAAPDQPAPDAAGTAGWPGPDAAQAGPDLVDPYVAFTPAAAPQGGYGRPEPHPVSYPPPPRSLLGLAWTTIGLLVLSCLADLLGLVNDTRLPGLTRRLEEEGFTDDLDAALTRWDQLNGAAALLQLLTFVVTGVLFVCWLWRARSNLESYGWTRQRRHRAWVICGWFTPVVALWFPFQVVADVWKASHPARQADQQLLDLLRATPLLGFWWAAYLATSLLSRVGWRQAEPADVDSLLTTVRFDEVCMVVDIGAAVLAVLVVRQITRFQQIRASAPVPWFVPPETLPKLPPLQLGAHA